MTEDKKCPICGKPTSNFYGKYREDGLCREHKDMLKDGLIYQCKNCGKWNNANETCKCKEKSEKTSLNQNKTSSCIICGTEAKGNKQCKNCYNETNNHYDNLDKNSNVRKLRDYYYNLKERILIIHDIKEVRNQCNKLIAIAMLNANINDDNSLMQRVYTDVENLISSKLELSKKQKEKPQQIKEEQKENDKNKAKIHKSQDGHDLDSDMEVHIDDILYNAFILHSCGNSIDEIIEKRKKCDWFIPISNGKGIYIEYWGKDDAEYLKDRKEKEELYKKYNVPYIGIEKDDPKKDTQTFKSNLLKDLRKLAIEKFGFMPEWKK